MSVALNLFSQQGREDILGSLGWFKRSSLSYPCLSKGELREGEENSGFLEVLGMRYYQLFNTAFLSTRVAPWVMELVPEPMRLLPLFESRCAGSWGWLVSGLSSGNFCCSAWDVENGR